MSKFVRFLREPLVHFFVIGFVLFGWSMARAPEAVPLDEVHVTAGQVENIATLFERTWKRRPTPNELSTLIEGHIREEVLFREAKALGLDRDDVIIRRRLVQKYDFLTDDVSALRQPSDEELETFLKAEGERYAIDARVSFQQIFLSLNNEESDIDQRIVRLRAELEAGGNPRLLGDPIDLPLRTTLADKAQIARSFGPQFAETLLEQSVGSWTGPIGSAYGQHLALVEAREDGRMPALAEVRAKVERDWLNAEQRELRVKLLDRLKQNYRIVIDPEVSASAEAAS